MRTVTLARVLFKGMSSEKHFSPPGRQKYFRTSNPRHISDTSSFAA